MNKTLVISILLMLTGCAFHQAPFLAYEGTSSISETAVFAAFNESRENTNVSVTSIDGKTPDCARMGCPVWVRVLPGQHSFTLRYAANPHTTGIGYAYTGAALSITIPKMEARHVYQANYREADGKVFVTVRDLGENPKFGLNLGMNGVNRKYYPVEF